MADKLRVADDYESKYMSSGEVLFRQKIKVPRSYHLLFLLPLLGLVAGTAGAALDPHSPAILSVVLPLLAIPFLLIWLLFAVLRLTVTKDQLLVQYGVFGPTVDLASIEKCEAVEYDWKQFGGWGIRYGRDGTVAYNMMGDAGHAVKVSYRKDGKSLSLLLSSPDPWALANAINDARARKGVRVGATTTATEVDEEAMAEAEAAAEEANETEKRA